jgi:uncharacterized phage infection (PIP) family protein YhgE
LPKPKNSRQLLIFALVAAVVLYLVWHLLLGIFYGLVWILTAAVIIVIIYLAVSVFGRFGKN